MRNHILSSAIALAAALSTPAFARPMTEVDLATLKRVAAPTASPDGRWVVFQMTETEGATYKRSTGLWLVDRNAKDAKPAQIADTAGKNETAPAFDKDGILYFLSNASGKSQVWRIDPKAGAAATQVTDTQADVSGFKISPDAAKLLAWGDIAKECTDFGCDAKDKGALPGPGSGRLYKDGAGFVRHWDEWETPGTYSRPFVFNLADGKASAARPVDAGLIGDSPSKPFGGGEELAWGADSRTVFFTLRKADRNEPMSTNLDIYSWLVDSRMMPANLTQDNQATDTLPTPSPDGKWLAYVAMARPGYEADRQVLMLRNLESGETKKLTEAWDRSVGSIAWAPDGKSLYVTAQDTLDHPVFRVDAASGKVEKLKASNEAFDGNIGDVAPLPGGALLYSRNSALAPTDLFVRDAKGKVKQLTAVNAARLAEYDAVELDRVQFAGANGDKVWGMIVKPVSPVQKLPVAFIVHGGPQSSFGNSWSTRWNPRVFAQQGYGVVTVDFHGSTGYGQAFTDSINKDWGGKPLEDLKLGLAAAGKQDPQLDITNACALGASYGGYMMNWIAGQWTDGFKCLVQHDGVFDLRAMAFETEELWFDEWDHGGPWWERTDPEKWNPVNHVAKWKTPMLVITSEKDFRIPYSQGLAAFTALQRRNIPSQLLVFPDENHWVLKGANSVQWHQTVFNWLGSHLKK
ncbi:peptidase S9 [Sphingopyxis sp. H038]|uniref:alpha/beta hydrolase family protein n=1 Tax=unclassified Sphingopyxis TaxID=2614943 RepID=UPI0007315BCC|nr:MULTISPECIES: S9 family peptidase [unclassified Sphingopyxis]KTE03137.1 peptidase S9 [Sphingopyxis sp. H012]KTE10516.1 peptidase S9 [Sphingopyxis sp. H053]KTE14561.1 peptidase S9 [Sphingopyxis sp. H093]KTE28703.1 peptidase S9 [Sphingopyxis sp. H080]KTE36119.1 peptidase S9 [Sphingopyxis sp. H038]